MSIKVMARVWDLSQHRGNMLLTLLALADYANDDGVCWPKLPTLAQRARTKERQLQEVLRTIETSGELYIQHGNGRGHTSMYAILVGMDEETIQNVLISYFELSPIEAHAIAQEKVQKTAPFLQKVRKSTGKGAVLGPQRVRKTARKGAVFRTEKVQFSAKQGPIQGIGMPRSDSDPSLRSVSDPPESDPPLTQGALALAAGSSGERDQNAESGKPVDLQTVQFLKAHGVRAWKKFQSLPFRHVDETTRDVRDNPRLIAFRCEQLAQSLVASDTSGSLGTPVPPDQPQLDPLAARWEQVQAALRQQIQAREFETWLKETHLIQCANGQALVGVPNIFARDKLAADYAPLISQVLGSAIEVVVVLDTGGGRS